MKIIWKAIYMLSMLAAMTIYAKVYAQDNSRSIIVQSGDFYVEANVLPKADATSGDKNLTYFWFRGNQINSTVGAYNSNLLHGKYASYYPSKNMKELGKFEKGLKTGVWESWYESGLRDQVIVMKHGTRNGPYRKYNSKGELIVQSSYKDGMLHGYLITYHSGKELLRRKYRNGVEIVEEEKEPKHLAPGKKRWRKIWPFNKSGHPKPVVKPAKEEDPADDEPQKT